MTRHAKERPHTWIELRRDWGLLSMYQRLEAFVALLLTLVVGAVIMVAFYRLIVSVIETLVLKSLNPLDHSVFQQVFGQIMTLLIALEFNHTLHYVITGERGIIHARMVILIAELALARKISSRISSARPSFHSRPGGAHARTRCDLLAGARTGRGSVRSPITHGAPRLGPISEEHRKTAVEPGQVRLRAIPPGRLLVAAMVDVLLNDIRFALRGFARGAFSPRSPSRRSTSGSVWSPPCSPSSTRPERDCRQA